MPFGKLGAGMGMLGSLGGAGNSGIQLSNASFAVGSAQGTAIGTLSVIGGIGTYTFTLTDSHSSAVQVAGTNGVNLQVGSAASSAGSFSITVHADNGAGSTFDRTFLITANSVVTFVPTFELLGF
jgi:hypothetical protein